jgi:hypothetical protein
VTPSFVLELIKLAEVNDQRLHPKPQAVPLAKPPNPAFTVKQAYATSEYSGVMSFGPFPQASMIPAWKHPQLKQSGPPGDSKLESTGDGITPDGRAHLRKNANVMSPASQLSKSLRIGAPRLKAPGPSIAQQSKPRGFGVPMPGLTKSAVMERLIRLGATDIPGTPRLLMKHRTPHELATLQHGVEGAWNSRVTDPIMRKLEPVANKLPAGKIRDVAIKGARLVAEDPIGMLAVEAVPIPGTGAAYVGAKKGLESLIDRHYPLPAIKSSR